jgi:glyoxylase I family protein
VGPSAIACAAGLKSRNWGCEVSDSTTTRALDIRPRRLHHAAWVTTDQEATRQFYEELIGVPLIATWAERAPSTGREYCHTFYEMGDGSALAFFQFADQEENPTTLESPGHVAFECDASTQGAIKARLESAGHATRLTDHGYCRSLYVNDPNHLRLEFTVDHPRAPEINGAQRPTAHPDLKRWMSGDHTPNNDFRLDHD